MIISFILDTILFFINSMFFLLPNVSLPDGVESFLSDGVAYYKMFANFFPPGDLFLELTLWYFTFKVGMIVAKFFFGARLPSLN